MSMVHRDGTRPSVSITISQYGDFPTLHPIYLDNCQIIDRFAKDYIQDILKLFYQLWQQQ
jgi:hypothetical protein